MPPHSGLNMADCSPDGAAASRTQTARRAVAHGYWRRSFWQSPPDRPSAPRWNARRLGRGVLNLVGRGVAVSPPVRFNVDDGFGVMIIDHARLACGPCKNTAAVELATRTRTRCGEMRGFGDARPPDRPCRFDAHAPSVPRSTQPSVPIRARGRSCRRSANTTSITSRAGERVDFLGIDRAVRRRRRQDRAFVGAEAAGIADERRQRGPAQQQTDGRQAAASHGQVAGLNGNSETIPYPTIGIRGRRT